MMTHTHFSVRRITKSLLVGTLSPWPEGHRDSEPFLLHTMPPKADVSVPSMTPKFMTWCRTSLRLECEFSVLSHVMSGMRCMLTQVCKCFSFCWVCIHTHAYTGMRVDQSTQKIILPPEPTSLVYRNNITCSRSRNLFEVHHKKSRQWFSSQRRQMLKNSECGP